MKRMDHTPAYWPARIMLVVGIVSCIAIVLAVITGFGLASGPCVSCDDRATLLGLPARAVISFAVVAPAVIGLVWMLRIFRGARDGSPAWRYRDRD
jgi:hypothetical protein